MPSPLTSVPGQVSAGFIDGFLREDAGDGTLGMPDQSLVPYTYAPLLEPVGGDLRWVVNQFRPGGYGAFKGTADGLGVLRSTGASNGAFMISVIPQNTGVKAVTPAPGTARSPDYTWGPQDFALAVRHPGTTGWTASNVRAYLAFMQAGNTVGMRLTTSYAQGPWDAEPSDAAALPLGTNGRPNMWDGASHTISVATIGQHVFCSLDYAHGLSFRAPRAYRHQMFGAVDTTVFSNLPSTGSYGGFDARGQASYLYSWSALQPASGDFFYYDQGTLTTQAAPSTTYTPTTTASGETWAITGTATASSNGLLLAASSNASFSPPTPHGLTFTKWGTVQSGGGLMVRRTDANNYYLITSAGAYRYTGGALASTLTTFSTPLVSGDNIAVRNLANQLLVYVNGQIRLNVAPSQGPTAAGIGFLNPAGGTSQFRYIAFQPLPNDPILPTS